MGGTGVDKFMYCEGDGNDTITGFESNKDIIDLYHVNYSFSRQGSDILMSLDSGSVLLKGAYGTTIKFCDRYGVSKDFSTASLSSSSAYLLEPSEVSYVSEASWSMDSAVDSVRAEKETAVLSPGTTGSVQDSTSLLYADTSGSLDRTGEEWKE